MVDFNSSGSTEKNMRILLVDHSSVFRRFLQETINGLETAQVCGVARSGITALDQVLKSKPHVILMDSEMPLMDGVTALQHLMIHRPTPTIIFSSQVEYRSKEEAIAMQNGAVAFFKKADFFDSARQHLFAKRIRQAIVKASQTEVEPIFASRQSEPQIQTKKSNMVLVFCEECGARNVMDKGGVSSGDFDWSCCKCGDRLILD